VFFSSVTLDQVQAKYCISFSLIRISDLTISTWLFTLRCVRFVFVISLGTIATRKKEAGEAHGSPLERRGIRPRTERDTLQQ
jgi:hypothetical protein